MFYEMEIEIGHIDLDMEVISEVLATLGTPTDMEYSVIPELLELLSNR